MNEQAIFLTALQAREKIAEGYLDLGGATIEGDLGLGGATIEGHMDLSFKKGPREIQVSPKQAQLVHWAAPTIPLVVSMSKR